MTPALHPWHRRVLRLLVRCGPLTAAEIGARLYAATPIYSRADVARHELRELGRLGLVDRDHGAPERWHPALFAAEALRRPTPTLGAPDLLAPPP
jgi:hypothetical protein